MQIDLFLPRRPINVWRVENDIKLVYVFTTHRFKTCVKAVRMAELKYPGHKFVANFAASMD